jgi:hypothetical protein
MSTEDRPDWLKPLEETLIARLDSLATQCVAIRSTLHEVDAVAQNKPPPPVAVSEDDAVPSKQLEHSSDEYYPLRPPDLTVEQVQQWPEGAPSPEFVAANNGVMHRRLRLPDKHPPVVTTGLRQKPAAAAGWLSTMDPELVGIILSFLPARAQCLTLQTCKLFALIITDEVQTEAAYLHSCVTESVESALTSLADKLTGPPTVGFLFCNIGAERTDALTALVKSLPPTLHLVGGEVATLVGTTPEGLLTVARDTGIALQLGRFPEAEVSSFVARPGGPLEDQLESQGALSQGPLYITNKCILIDPPPAAILQAGLPS